VSFPSSFEIGGRPVGVGRPTWVIAEIGANHNRDMGTARELIDAAAEAGADAVKFQTYSGERIYSRKTPSFEYLKSDEPPAELLERISLPRDWQAPLAEHAASRDVQFFSSRSTTRRSASWQSWACRCSRSRCSRSWTCR